MSKWGRNWWVSRLTACVYVCSFDQPPWRYVGKHNHSQQHSMWHTHTVHSEQKHSSSIRTFTRVSCPRLNRLATLSLWRHRKAKLHVSFSYRGKPLHRLPLFTLMCGCFTRPLFFVICPVENSFLHAAFTKSYRGSWENASYKHSLSIETPGSSNTDSQSGMLMSGMLSMHQLYC